MWEAAQQSGKNRHLGLREPWALSLALSLTSCDTRPKSFTFSEAAFSLAKQGWWSCGWRSSELRGSTYFHTVKGSERTVLVLHLLSTQSGVLRWGTDLPRGTSWLSKSCHLEQPRRRHASVLPGPAPRPTRHHLSTKPLGNFTHKFMFQVMFSWFVLSFLKIRLSYSISNSIQVSSRPYNSSWMQKQKGKKFLFATQAILTATSLIYALMCSTWSQSVLHSSLFSGA